MLGFFEIASINQRRKVIDNPKSPHKPAFSSLLDLSDTGYRVLRQLQKGCAYRVHGAWRFRGSHSSTHNATLVGLMTKGLAEIIDIGGHTQFRITPAGSAIKRPTPPLEVKIQV